MNQLSTYSWTFDEDVIRYAQAGYRSIGVWRSKLSDFGEDRGIELLHEFDMEVSNLFWAGGFTGCDGRSFAESIDDALEAVELAGELDAECLVLYTGSRSGHTRNHARRLSRRAIDRLAPEAERLGLALAVAPAHAESGGEWTFLHQLTEVVDFVRTMEQPNVKLAFDTYHLGQADIDFDLVKSIAPQVAIVHLADAQRPPNGEMNCCLLGDGRIPIAKLLAALSEGGYQGYYDVKLLGEDVESVAYEDVLEHSHAALTQLDQQLADR